MQEKEFSFTKKLLFDGESSLRSKINQQIIKNQLNIDCFADPYFKRTMAERSVREFKTRMSIRLDQFEKRKKNNGINFKLWKDHINPVVDSINRNKKSYRSKTAILLDYFTQKPTPSLPQNQNRLYRYEIGTQVRFFLTKAERQQLGFKYSLAYGKISTACFYINIFYDKLILYRCFIPLYRGHFKSSSFQRSSRHLFTILYCKSRQ